MHINYWAVLAAAAAACLLAAAWYGVVFRQAWLRAAAIDPQRSPSHRLPVVAGIFLFSALSASVFALMLPAHVSISNAVGVGATVGVCWVATSFGINSLIARRSLTLWLIDVGYHTLQFMLYGLILGAWR